jgi:hypothetical protein
MKKTGLAKQMRAWMREQKRPFFTRESIYTGLDIPVGPDRIKVYAALKDFIERGEVITDPDADIYRYNHKWKPGYQDGIRQKILKAIYVSISRFTVSDIQRISGAPEKSYVTKIITRLYRSGYLNRAGRCKTGMGTEHVYAVTSRDKYRMEIL